MLKDRKELENYLSDIILMNIKNKKQLREWTNIIVSKHNIPVDLVTSFLSSRRDMSEFSNAVLYYMLDTINDTKIKRYFTDKEISTYSTSKYTKNEVKFPLTFNMIQVADDQWIGRITAKEILELKDAQLIYYNENTQRPLKRIVKDGNVDYWKISINNKAVNAITESYENGTYIPNTITFAMPETTDYYYNKDTSKLTIKSLTAFDIIDGYHRYIAMTRQSLKNSDFDYPMEIRIVSFDEKKARQFIWQEDQKTKMSRINSDSYNIYNAGNQLTNYLNTNSLFAGNINNNGIISAALFSEVFNTILFGGRMSKVNKTQILIENRRKICERLNSLLECEPELITKNWDKNFTIAVAIAICKYDSDIYKIANQLSKNITPNRITKSYINKLLK